MATFLNPPFDQIRNLIECGESNVALEGLAGAQAELKGGNDAEESVAAEDELEPIGVLSSGAGNFFAFGGEEAERFDVLDERGVGEAASVHIGGHGTAEGEGIGSGLFLNDGPGERGIGLAAVELFHQPGPDHTGGDFDDAAFGIEIANLLEAGQVEVNGFGSERLSAHGMATAGDAESAVVMEGATENADEFFAVVRAEDALDFSRGEAGMHIIDPECFARFALAAGQKGGGTCQREGLQKGTPGGRAHGCFNAPLRSGFRRVDCGLVRPGCRED